MNTTKSGLRGRLTGRVGIALAAAIAAGTVLIPQKAEAVFNYQYGVVYQQDFDGPDGLGTGDSTPALNTSALNQLPASTGRPDWFGTFGSTAVDTDYLASTGMTNGFLNLGATGGPDRAYGYSGS